jgi:kumamolisin
LNVPDLDKSQTITVSLGMRPMAPIPSPVPGAPPMSVADLEANHGADPNDIAAATKYAIDNGLSVVSVDAGQRVIQVSGTIAQIEAAFKTELEQRMTPVGEHRFAVRAAPPIPHLGIQAVLGLESAPFAQPRFRKRDLMQTRASGTAVLGPVKTAQLYGVTQRTAQISKVCQAGILCLGGGYTAQNVADTCALYGIPVPNIVDHSVMGAVNSPGSDADIELLLDILWQAGMYFARTGRALTIHIAFCPNTDAGYLAGGMFLTHLGVVCTWSDSWGSPESQWSAQSIQQEDQAGQGAAAVGVTINVASGDGGSTDGTGSNVTDYYAASTRVLAWGGTELTAALERVWSDAGGGASGGGVSQVETPQPSWQTAYGPQTGRCVPDLAMNGAPSTCCTLVYEGQQQDVGGTSAAAPGGAGMICWMCEELPQNIGYLNPSLPLMPATCFNDITVGNNGYPAQKGPDLCTGWGSPRPMAMLAFLQGAAPPPVVTPPSPPPDPIPPPGPAPSGLTVAQFQQNVFDNLATDFAADKLGAENWLQRLNNGYFENLSMKSVRNTPTE